MQQDGNMNNDFDKFFNEIGQLFKGMLRGSKGNGSFSGGGGGGDNGNTANLVVIGGVVVAVFLLLAGYNSFYTIDEREEGVVTRFGKYLETTMPGPHFKLPWIDRVYKVKSKKNRQEEFGYRKSTTSRSRYGRRLMERGGAKVKYKEESLMLSGDLNLADVEWMVQYEISDPRKYLFRAHVGNIEKSIRDVSMSVMRRIVGDRLVDKVLTTDRSNIAIKVRDLMQETLDRYDIGIRILTVVLQSVNPPEKVKPAFNDVNAAKQEQEEAINRAERQYNRVIPEARGKADKKIADAKAFAIDLVNRAKGDAARFTSILMEYRKAPAITRKRIYLDVMEEVFQKTDNFTVVDKGIKGLLPIFSGKGDLTFKEKSK